MYGFAFGFLPQNILFHPFEGEYIFLTLLVLAVEIGLFFV